LNDYPKDKIPGRPIEITTAPLLVMVSTQARNWGYFAQMQ